MLRALDCMTVVPVANIYDVLGNSLFGIAFSFWCNIAYMVLRHLAWF
jgi:hypothetical protein